MSNLNTLLQEVTDVLEQSFDWDQKISKIKEILEAANSEKNSIFELIKNQNLWEFTLLLGFCYILAVGTRKDEKQAFSCCEKDGTPYGHYILGQCYKQGWG